jgi:hypothetical protein
MGRNHVEVYWRRLSTATQDMEQQMPLVRAHRQEPERLGKVAHIGCFALEGLTQNTQLRDDLERIILYRREHLEDMQLILEDVENFERFLKIEKDLLRLGDVDPGVITFLIYQFEELRNEVRSTEFSVDTVLGALDQLRVETCRLADEKMNQAKWEGFQQRLIQGIGGTVLVGLNVSTVAASLGLSTPAMALSGAFGGVFIGKAVE